MTDTNRTFAELRIDAEFLNSCCVDEGLPEPIPNYASMRKDELEQKMTKYEQDTNTYLAEYGFVLVEE